MAGVHEQPHSAGPEDQELAGLEQGGVFLTIWFDPDMAMLQPPTGKRGRQPRYGGSAIQTCLTAKLLFGAAVGNKTGFVERLLRLIHPDWRGPDFSRLGRRQKILPVIIPCHGSKGTPRLLIDSTGIKVEGGWVFHPFRAETIPAIMSETPLTPPAWRGETSSMAQGP
ncbi:transposase [Rhodovulum sulfidophilum]|uniref:transposase n=1 Tax=Rhodovulum sulfidophilum TaxID=35806 RepID=UPI00398C41EC